MSGGLQLCTFSVGDLFLGVNVLEVQEVIRSQEMTRVPLAPPAVAGLLNLRGQIVGAIDLRRRLGLADRVSGEAPMNVVVRTADGAVGMLVDEIGDVIEVMPEAIESPPETLSVAARAFVDGVCKLPTRLLLVLAIRHVVTMGPVESQSR